MNILILVDAFFPDHTGGITKSLLPEIEGLVSLGHQVTVVSRLQSDKSWHESKEGYELYRYFSPYKKSIFYRLYPLFSFTTLPQLISQLNRKYSFNIAYVHNPFQLAGLKHVLPQLPCVYVYHASVYSEINLDVSKGKYGRFNSLAKITNSWVKTLESKSLLTADKVIVRSLFMRNDINQLYGNINNTFIPLCVDLEKLYFADNNIAGREKLKLPKERPILLTIRRLVARMGIENLIMAMNLIVQQFPDVLLLIGGTGYLEEDFRQMIKMHNLEYNINILGFIPEELIATYYQAADLFVLPTLAYEGFGLVTIESLACGTPVIATPVGASSEILNPLGKEFLFNDTTPEGIFQGINYCLAKGFSVDIRRYCRDYCLQNFGKQKICIQLQDSFINCIAENQFKKQK